MNEMAIIESNEIVIRIPIDALPDAAQVAWDDYYGFEQHSLFVENIDKFAKEFVIELNSETEDGTTLLHIALDRAAVNAAENGALGIGDHSA